MEKQTPSQQHRDSRSGPITNMAIIGAGLVGSLLAIYLSKRGYAVSVYERRPDVRQEIVDAGRSINLALSNRGLRSLEEVDVLSMISQIAIPMHGRMMHARDGKLTFQPYGKEGEFINSISRSELNRVLIHKAETLGAKFYFNQRATHVDFENTTLTCIAGEASTATSFDAIIGADGAFSAVRASMQFSDRFNFSQQYLAHGYKELHIPSGEGGAFKLEKNALHIWPRESFMLIALPNPDGSFTCTLFFSFEGTPSFNTIKTEGEIHHFFEKYFPDAFSFMPQLAQDFRANPMSSLVTMKCYPWVKNKTLLIGDAAHAIVPFYGQGMNAGFEDCRILNALLENHRDDWKKAIELFQQVRKSDTDAIAALALNNFIEMRDLVADEDFLIRKKIEAKLHALYPDQWIPLYSMVTFNENIRYSDALRIGEKQKRIMDEVMKKPGIKSNWESLDFQRLVHQVQGA